MYKLPCQSRCNGVSRTAPNICRKCRTNHSPPSTPLGCSLFFLDTSSSENIDFVTSKKSFIWTLNSRVGDGVALFAVECDPPMLKLRKGWFQLAGQLGWVGKLPEKQGCRRPKLSFFNVLADTDIRVVVGGVKTGTVKTRKKHNTMH